MNLSRYHIFLIWLFFGVVSGLIDARASDLSSIFFFGDSLTDEGRAGRTAAVMWPGVFRNDTSIAQGANYAIGGATTSNQPSATFGDSSYLGQVNAFVGSATPVTSQTQAGVWIGTNNIWIGSAHGQSAATLAANASADVSTGIHALTSAGVSRVLLLGVYDLSLTNAYQFANADTSAVRQAAASASQQYNARLASLSVPGASIVYFDIANFINYLQTHPSAYGFQKVFPLLAGASCGAACQQTSIFTDTIHLTSKTQQLIGDYIASGNPIYNAASFTYGGFAADYSNASVAAPIPTELARSAGAAFAASLFDRLDALRFQAPRSAGSGRSAATAQPLPNPWSIFSYGGVAQSLLPHLGSVADATRDLDYSVAGVTLGAEYDSNEGLRFGAVFNYGRADANLVSNLGVKTTVDAYQGAAYASLSSRTWFLDAVATAGTVDAAQTRTGIFGRTDASPRGSVVTTAARGGTLAPIGLVRVGPVLGLRFSRTAFDAYTETGPSTAAITYGSQASNGLVGSAGAEIRLAEPARINPILTVAYDHDFIGKGQTIPLAFAYLPTQTFTTSTYPPENSIKVVLGSAMDFAGGWSGSASVFGLKGTQGARQIGLNGGMGYRF